MQSTNELTRLIRAIRAIPGEPLIRAIRGSNFAAEDADPEVGNRQVN